MREINLCGREKKFQDILFAKKIFVKQNKFSSLDFRIIRVDIIFIVHGTIFRRQRFLSTVIKQKFVTI